MRLIITVYEAKKAIAAVARSVFVKSNDLEKSGVLMADELTLEQNVYKYCKNLFWHIKLGACVGYRVNKEQVFINKFQLVFLRLIPGHFIDVLLVRRFLGNPVHSAA